MNTPTISQYAESVCHPYGRFRTLGEPAVERDAYGEPLLYAGGNAAVFKVWLAGRPYALKCYTRPGKRNGMLYAYLAARRTPDAAALRSPVPTRRTLHLWPGRRRGVVRYRADRVGRRGFAWIRRKESAPSPRYGENGRPVPWFRRDGCRTALHAVGTRRPETGEHHGRD